MERERAWERVQAALDERRDPFDDELLQEWFADHPRELEEYARLERRLGALPGLRTTVGAPTTNARPRRRLVELAATLAATLLAIVAAHRMSSEHDQNPQVDHVLVPRVIDYQITTTRKDGEHSYQASRSLNGPLRITTTRSNTNSAAHEVGAHWVRHTSETETN